VAVRRVGAAAYALMLLAAGCSRSHPQPAFTVSSEVITAVIKPPAVMVTFDGAPPLVVEVASTEAAREHGLMGRTQVPAGTGMLFEFPSKSTGGFWMKNTLVPLSIAYVDGDRVVSTAEMVPCPAKAAQCPTYEAAAPYTAAVETWPGFFAAHGVVAGTRMLVEGPTPVPR
jgi:uncharacterized membrane protein (UPF0127 family)